MAAAAAVVGGAGGVCAKKKTAWVWAWALHGLRPGLGLRA